MKRLKDEKELLETLKEDINDTNKKTIVFLGGHFPLRYSKDKDEAIEALYEWGSFSKYTLELACKTAKYAKEIGKNIKFVFFVDDHIYEDESIMASSSMSRKRRNLYIKRSGKGAVLPEEYKKIMEKYGFSEKDVIRHNQKKQGRGECLYFSEKVLRASSKRIQNACAREYIEFLEDKKYFDKKIDYMIAFIPQRCQGHICDVALDKEIKGLTSSHIFVDSMAKLTSENGLYSFRNGILYRKDKGNS